MSYVQKILQPDEQIVHSAAIHWVVYLRSIFLLVLGIAVLGWFLSQNPTPPDQSPLWNGAALGIGCLLVAGSAYAFLQALIERHSTELVITSRRVIAKTGLIRRHTWEINAAKVEGVEVSQSILGRIFDFGTVTVKGTGGGTAPIRNIDDPVAFRSHVTSL
jgi:uncharacterized membrane protein YdbT with pleckstrin-like domain